MSKIPPLSDTAMEFARRGEVIAAIRQVREDSGASLVEAKQAVDAWLAAAVNQTEARSRIENVDIPYQAQRALRDGDMIEAVRRFRAAHGGGLKAAKDRLDEHLALHERLNETFRAARGARRTRLIGILVLFASLVGIAFVAWRYLAV